MSIKFLLAAGMMLAAIAPAAAVQIKVNANAAAGLASFNATRTVLDWRNLYAPGTSWTLGVGGGPIINAGVVNDTINGGTASGSLAIFNWIDGPGFGADIALPDLAIGGPEDWDLTTTTAERRIGFAMSTGSGLLPNEVSGGAVSFTVTTSAGSGGFTLPGAGSYFITITSASPVSQWQIREVNGAMADQYFGNVLAGDAGAVPEPSAWLMLIAGFGLVGAAARRRAFMAG